MLIAGLVLLLGRAMGYTEPLLEQISMQRSCSSRTNWPTLSPFWLGRTVVWRITHPDCTWKSVLSPCQKISIRKAMPYSGESRVSHVVLSLLLILWISLKGKPIPYRAIDLTVLWPIVRTDASERYLCCIPANVYFQWWHLCCGVALFQMFFKWVKEIRRRNRHLKISCNVFSVLPVTKVSAELCNSRHSEGTGYKTLER